ncbi:MAG TPA: hypothetical protein VFJ84_03725 [Candidatus Saccharimonadales bacterium]|nr:hypothetical protein [Candidatus Saccharimonadales bacterium]
MPNENLIRLALSNDLAQEEGEPIKDRAALGEEVAAEYNTTPSVFRYLQALVAGEGAPLPYAPTSVRIVVAKDGWREDFALVYGFPAVEGPYEPGKDRYSQLATRFPEEAAQFKVYFGTNYGKGGYGRVETVQELDPEIEARLKAGDFTDEEAEALLAESSRQIGLYWDLNVAARDPKLNPDFADRANESFYQHASGF